MPEIKLTKRVKYAGDVHTALMLKLDFDPETAAAFCDSIPDTDAVEVVRCGACLHRSQYADQKGLYKCGAIQCEDGHCIKVSPGFSCAAGKRRTGGDTDVH